MDHIILRALVKTNLICIIESIRDMYVDISCRKRLGAEEERTGGFLACSGATERVRRQ
jgi:hypothetical protein